jgi:DNA-binding MarR family transcriptional regulator
MVERVHRQCLEVVKAELERMGVRNLNNVQALILFNIGEAELTIGELTQRGYYLGSNVSYNVKKMVENGYLIQQRSPHDGRAYYVRVSDSGKTVVEALAALFERHANELAGGQISGQSMKDASRVLGRVQLHWSGQGQLLGLTG